MTAVFELAGAPGCGKSTIVSALAERCASPRIVIGNLANHRLLDPWRGRRHWGAHGLIAAASSPALLHRLLIYAASIGALNWQGMNFVRRTLHLVRTIDGLNRETDDQAVVIDQGLIQFVASLAISGHRFVHPATDLVVRLLANRISGVIWVDTALEVALGRLSSRAHGDSRFDRMNEAALEVQYRRFAKILAIAKDIAIASGVPVLTLDGDQPPHASAAALARWVDQFDLRADQNAD